MYPIICKIGPFTIYSYGLMLALAFTASVMLAMAEAKRQHIDPEIILNFSFLLFISGIVGGRILYMLENINYYIKNPIEIVLLQHGGLSWFGGLVFAIVFGIIYIKKKKLLIYKTFDLVIPFVALGQAIGRIGCLLNGCCFGKESTRFGIYFNMHSSFLIPTQAYSALLLILIFIILRLLQNKPHREGEIFFTYLLLYSLKRFFIEFWRADNPVIFWELTLFQVMSLLIFFLALTKLILIKKTKVKV